MTVLLTMDKNTIAIIGDIGLLDNRAAAVLCRNIARAVSNNGINCSIVDLSGTHESQVLNSSERVIKKGSIRKLFFLNNNSEFANVTSDVRLVCLYNPKCEVAASVLRYCHSRKIKTCLILTEWYSTADIRNIVHKLFEKIRIEIGMRLINKHADCAIVSSPLLEQYYSGHFPILLMPTVYGKIDINGMNVDEDSNKGKKRLIFCGHPTPEKENLGHFIELLETAACTSNKKYEVLVVGVTRGQYEELYGRLPSLRFGVIYFAGLKPHEECLKAISESDYSIVYRASNKKTNAGFPTKFAESIACGTPVITTDTSCIVRYLKEGNNGYILSFNDTVAVKQLSDILSNSNKTILQQKKYCREHPLFNIEWAAERLEAFFNI